MLNATRMIKLQQTCTHNCLHFELFFTCLVQHCLRDRCIDVCGDLAAQRLSQIVQVCCRSGCLLGLTCSKLRRPFIKTLQEPLRQCPSWACPSCWKALAARTHRRCALLLMLICAPACTLGSSLLCVLKALFDADFGAHFANCMPLGCRCYRVQLHVGSLEHQAPASSVSPTWFCLALTAPSKVMHGSRHSQRY